MEGGRGLDEKEADEEGGGGFPLRIRISVRQVGSGASQPFDSAFYSIIVSHWIHIAPAPPPLNQLTQLVPRRISWDSSNIPRSHFSRRPPLIRFSEMVDY
jgi:hypothetical protein